MMQALAAAILWTVLASSTPLRPVETAGAWVRLGPEGRRLHVELRAGRLRVRDDARRVLHESAANEHVYGFAAAPFLRERCNQLLVWFARRDSNRAGVVPHHSGWMDYGTTPWIASHIAFLEVKGPALVECWVSSGTPRDVEAVFVCGPGHAARRAAIVTRERGGEGAEIVWYRFGTWSLNAERRLPVAQAGPLGLASKAQALEMVDLVAVGDVMLGRATGVLLARHSNQESLGDVRPLLWAADVALGNLEGCPTSAPRPRRGDLDLAARREHSRALRFLGFDAVSIANNHCGAADLPAAVRWLAAAGARAVGLPASDQPFGRPVVIEGGGLRLAVVAAQALPGDSASLAALRSGTAERQLGRLKTTADAVIVMIHWGEEYAREPAPWQRALAHLWIDAGADAVLGHHPHVVQEVEEYRGRFLAYSLGNFLFDQEGYVREAQGATERGLALRLRFHKRLGWCADKIGLRIVDRFKVLRED